MTLNQCINSHGNPCFDSGEGYSGDIKNDVNISNVKVSTMRYYHFIFSSSIIHVVSVIYMYLHDGPLQASDEMVFGPLAGVVRYQSRRAPV